MRNCHAIFPLAVHSVFFSSLLSCCVIGRLRPDWHCSRCAFDEASPWTSRGAARSRFVFLPIIDRYLSYPFFICSQQFARVCIFFKCCLRRPKPNSSAFRAFLASPGDLGRSQARTGQGGGRGGESRGFREILVSPTGKDI